MKGLGTTKLEPTHTVPMSTAMGGATERNEKNISGTQNCSLHIDRGGKAGGLAGDLAGTQEIAQATTFLKKECMFSGMPSSKKINTTKVTLLACRRMLLVHQNKAWQAEGLEVLGSPKPGVLWVSLASRELIT